VAGGRDDVVFADAGRDKVYGGDGHDVVHVFARRVAARARDGDDDVLTSSGNDEIRAGRCDDTLFGNPGDDYLDGGPGTDDLDGWRGTDRA
jgi:Ca2+-binding RTX toxin-like protein